MMNYTSKVLPTRENRAITLFTHHLLLLQIPIVEYGLEDWWMSNFINLHYRFECPTFYEYTDFEMFYKDLFDSSKLTFEDARRFNNPETFTEFIEQGKYIYAWIDNYYLGVSIHYQKRHDIHPILIYGYDNEQKVYYIKGFDTERSLFDARADFDQVHEALRKTGDQMPRVNNEDSVQIIKPKNFVKCDIWNYEYQYERVLSELYDYMTGRGKIEGVYFTLKEDNPQLFATNHSAFGLNVTELFRNGLVEKDLRLFDYRVAHMITENKWLIANRIVYFCNKVDASHELRTLAVEYLKLAEAYGVIRQMYMKFSYEETEMRTFYPAPKKTEHIAKLVSKTDELLAKERDLLSSIYPLMISEYLTHVRFKGFDFIKMNKVLNEDEEGVYYQFTCQSEYEAEGIAVFDIHKYVTGRYVFNDNEAIEIRARDLGNHFLVTKPLDLLKTISSIKFYPDLWLGSTDIDTFSLYLCIKKGSG